MRVRACERACSHLCVATRACVLSCVRVCAAGDSRLHLWSVNRRLRVTAGHFPNAWDIPAASAAPRRTPRRHLRLLRIVLGLGCVHSCACARMCVFIPMASARTRAAPIAVTWSAGSLRQASSGRYLLRPHSLCTDAGIVTLSTKISLNIIDTTSLTIPSPPELLASGGWTQAENERSKVVYQSQVSAPGETCMGQVRLQIPFSIVLQTPLAGDVYAMDESVCEELGSRKGLGARCLTSDHWARQVWRNRVEFQDRREVSKR
jgi:hypothetical protein